MNPDTPASSPTTVTPTTPTAPKYTSASFAEAIKQKYPTGVTSDGIPYAKLSPEELTRRIVAKYPVYKDQIKPTLGEGPAGQAAGNAVRAVAAPLVRTGSIPERGLDQTVGRVINATQGKGFTPTHTGADAAQAATDTEEGASGSIAGHVGTFVGNVAPYLSGLGEEEVGAKIASMIPQLAEKLGMKAETLLPKVAQYLTSKVPALAGNTAIGTAQSGNLTEGAKTGLEATAGQEIVGGIAKGVKKLTTPKSFDSVVRDLVTPEQTTGKTGTLTSNIKAGRVDEGGLVTGRTVNPDTHQLAIEDAVKKVPGIKSSNTALQNANAIHDHIGQTAQNLETSLANRDVQPIVTQEHWNNYLNGVKEDISQNPLLVGDAEKTAGKILNKFQTLLPKQGDITATDVLKARKGLDGWIKNIKGSTAFDPKTENAVSIGLRAVRQGANDLLEQTAPDVGVKDMLRHQSLLYDALENVAPKAAKEAGSVVGRVVKGVKEHPIISAGAGIVGADVLLRKLGL